MADRSGFRRRSLPARSVSLDLDAVRAMVRRRVAARSLGTSVLTQAIGRHAEAIGRGDASVSPAHVRIRRRVR